MNNLKEVNEQVNSFKNFIEDTFKFIKIIVLPYIFMLSLKELFKLDISMSFTNWLCTFNILFILNYFIGSRKI
jgi:hypothetical protein